MMNVQKHGFLATRSDIAYRPTISHLASVFSEFPQFPSWQTDFLRRIAERHSTDLHCHSSVFLRNKPLPDLDGTTPYLAARTHTVHATRFFLEDLRDTADSRWYSAVGCAFGSVQRLAASCHRRSVNFDRFDCIRALIAWT